MGLINSDAILNPRLPKPVGFSLVFPKVFTALKEKKTQILMFYYDANPFQPI